MSRLLIDISWNCSRLEGNTYSLLETERLIKLSEIVGGKDLKEAQARFIEVVETEIMHMHEGNFGRYKLTHPEYITWREEWNRA